MHVILVHGGESDVIRIFDGKLRLSEKQMQDYLKKADLENYGFTKTVEVSTETDENGRKTTKRTIYYKVTDDCSRVMFWEGVLEKRMPKELQASKLSQITVKEVEKRIAGRDTKQCTVGLEIHLNRCLTKSDNDGKSKRAARGCSNGFCLICFTAAISYK